ncbi:putative glycosyl hydrolase [Talaromyces proteolyticus]|uniref:Mannan endo-1,6-alpha-mannosidase n=1 Tax=Talaromyces proteolyticus TaxID=1131652 RepID=A0AAD4PUZ1_9EURO|nr:putative glycosyl hydrolase [Talaromyces proteolyticus]KAH8692804.1 putative glycosyl hydrolase [Talaromyces proteolyticus]
MRILICQLLPVLSLVSSTAALTITSTNPDSFKAAATTAAANAVASYNARQSKDTPGKFDGTWWEGGAFFNFLINYWHWTGDSQYNDIITEGMSYQGGSNNDFYPQSVQGYIGNDDQEFWALAAMTAAEQKFPDNPKPGSIGWLGLAQGAYNDFAARWAVDNSSCGGGLRWQLVPTLSGYGAKNAISNGAFFQLAARLYWYTGNETYANMAETVWDWSVQSKLFNNQTWYIWDMTLISENCQDPSGKQWSYNYGSYAAGAAYMYNKTKANAKWKTGLDGILGMTYSTFFPAQYGSNTMAEIGCDPWKQCDRDQLCFKGLLASWLSTIALIAPYTQPDIFEKLMASAVGAGQGCTDTQCGQQWYAQQWDGTSGIEQDMSALSVFANALAAFPYNGTAGPVSADNGGNSTANPTGGGSSGETQISPLKAITGGDRAGAAILTLIFCGGWIAAVTWLVRADIF